MNLSIKKVIGNSFFFSIGVIFSKAIGIIMLPIYTHFLDSGSFGIATTVTGFVSTFCVVLTLSLRSALMRFYNEYTDEAQRQRFVGSIVSIIILNSFIVISLSFVFRNHIMMMFFKGLEFFPMVALGLIALFFDGIYAIYQSILQTKQEGKAYTLNSSLYLLLNAIFNIIYIVFIQLGGISLVLSLLCTNIVFSIYSIYRLLNKRIMVFCLDGKIIKTALKYSLPILPHDLSNNISNYLSKIILNVNISYAVSGLFTVATQISSIMNLVQSSINLAFRPWFNEQMNLGVEGKKNIKKFSIFVFSIYGFVSLCIAYFCQELLYIFVSQEYLASWKVVPMLLMSLVISFIYYIHVLTIMYNLKASRFVFACSLTGCIANILFSLLLIPRFSIMGAGVAKLLSQIILAAVTVIISRKTEYVDFGLRIMIQQTGFIVAMMLTGLYFGYLHNLSGFIWLNILYKLLLLIFGGTVLFWRQRKETYYLFMRFIHRVKRK